MTQQHFLPDRIDDRYERLKQIWQGVDSSIFLVRDRLFPLQPKTLKIFHNSSEEFTAIIRDQFHTMHRCSFSNLVRTYELGIDPETNRLYYTMEWIEQAKDLYSNLQNQNIIDIGLQICRTLSYIHHQGLSLVDINREHILLLESKTSNKIVVIILNYGCAIDEGYSALISRLRSITSLAPELIRGDPSDQRGDIYALGIYMYELVTGEKPFTGTVGQILKKHLTEIPSSEQIDPDINRILQKMLAKQIDNRYAQAEDIAMDFQEHYPGKKLWESDGEHLGVMISRFVNRSSEFKCVSSSWLDLEIERKSHTMVISGNQVLGNRD